MVRVIYRWQVEPRDFEQFKKAWRRTTNGIHETVAGAQGSFMLRSCEDSSEVITVAKWDSLASWKHFFADSNPKQMTAMTKLGKRISVEAFEEIEDHTRNSDPRGDQAEME